MSRPATARRPVAPRAPRRVSGPARPGHPAPARAPRPRPRPVPAPPATQRTGPLQTVSDHRYLDSLLRSRAWIWILALGLGGIVAMQVSLLKLNTGISRAVESASTLERQNAQLEVQVARLSSDANVRIAAERLGLVRPDASAVYWLQARGERDALRAAARMTPPSAEAQTLLASGGRMPTATPAAMTPAPLAGTTAPATAVTPQPTATAQPAATPAPTPTPAPAAAAAGGQTAPPQN